MLYSCKNNIDSDEIKKMVPYFWKKFYFNLILRSTILIFLISIIISIGCQNMIEGILFFVIVFVFILIYYKANLSSIVAKSVNSHIIKKEIHPEIEIEFYNTYLFKKRVIPL